MLNIFKTTALIIGIALLGSCADDGESGSSDGDCGEHGSSHDGHCHCDEGYLTNGETCVTPAEITEICGAETRADDDHHGACRCPAEGECPCADGEIELHAAQNYCVPELHDDE